MSPLDLLAPHAAMIGLTACRIGGFVASSPFPGNELPRSQRIGMVAILSLVVGLWTPAANVHLDGRFVAGVASELGIGISIGFVLRLSLVAADVAGGLLSQATGLGIASVLDPSHEGSQTAASRLVTLMALAIAVAAGAHRTTLAFLLESFRSLPIGTPIDPAHGAAPLIDWAGRAIVLGVRIAMPVTAIALLAQVILAIVARTAPALQLFNLGVTVMVGVGFATFFASAPDLAAGLLDDVEAVPSRIDRLLVELQP